MRPRVAAAVAGSLLALAAAPALGAGPSCHCFRDRDFDPGRPAASDPYLLATTANSLLAAVSGTPKREIVQARMSGVSADELWIAAHAASRLAADPAELRRARAVAGSWAVAIDARGERAASLGSRFLAALTSGAADDALARAAAAEALAARLGVSGTDLDALAAAGATLQETILASLIGLWSGRPAAPVFAETTTAPGSWSGALAALGRTPGQMESEIARMLSRPGP